MATAPPGYTPEDAYQPISSLSAFPYWTVREDSTVCTAVWGVPVALDETSVALVSAGYSPIAGSYSVQLSAYADVPVGAPGYYRSSSISQTGLIPFGTQSIRFLMASPSQAGAVQPNPVVTLNGVPISISELSRSGGIISMGGNIGAFAGTAATLAFSCQAIQGAPFPANENIFNLDNIQFSTLSVPEPKALTVIGVGVLLTCLCRRRRGAHSSSNSMPSTTPDSNFSDKPF